MRRVSRKELLKVGAGSALALGVAAVAPRAAKASGDKVAIHIHGVVTGQTGTPAAGATLAVSIDVAGRPDNLAGAGWDSPTPTAEMVPGPGPTSTSGPVGACIYTAAGQLIDDDVQLQGRSLFTNRALPLADSEDPGRSDTRADGRLVQISANLETGAILWSLGTPVGTFFFAGQGVVTKIN